MEFLERLAALVPRPRTHLLVYPEEHLWLVDPHDGTSAFLAGWRGAAVSNLFGWAATALMTVAAGAFFVTSWG